MKKNNESSIKLLCYMGIFVLLLFIVLPPLFRVMFPEDLNPGGEKPKLVMNLNCVKTENFVEYEIKSTINTNYVEGVISDSTFTYDLKFNDELFEEDVEIEEYETLKMISNVDFEEEKNKYILRINYEKFDYSNEPLLSNHKMIISEQLEKYTNDHYECKTTKVSG